MLKSVATVASQLPRWPAFETYLKEETGTVVEMTGVERPGSRWLIDGRFYTPAVLACQWEGEQASPPCSRASILIQP